MIEKGQKANDVDILVILEKESYNDATKLLFDIWESKPKKLHNVMMTPKDFREKIKSMDTFIESVIKCGVFIFGTITIIEAISYGTT